MNSDNYHDYPDDADVTKKINLDKDGIENTQDIDVSGNYPQNRQYNMNGQNNYNPPGGYGYGAPYQKPKSNTGLVVAVSILAAVVVIGIAAVILALTGVITFGGKTDTASTADVQTTEAPTSAPTAAVQPQAPAHVENNVVSRYVYVVNVKNSIYFRSAPSENDSNIITEIPLGTQVGFIENVDSVFAKINYNGQIGYAKQQYLADEKPYVSANNTVSYYVYVANVKNSIYFRSAPSENDSNIITEIPLGTQVGFIENTDSVFAKISYNGQIGYAKREYLSSVRQSRSTMTVVNVDYAIYLRSTPSDSSDSNIIMEIPVGATVSYIGTPNNTFYEISYNGTTGYAKQIYLSFD